MVKTYPTWIDDGSAIPDPFGHGERAVNFVRNLKHPKSKGRGRPFQLDPWMERIIRRIYGPRHPGGSRIVQTVFAMVPRGNRKTTLGAALTLLHLIGPQKTPGGQIVCAAADQKQARIAFEEAKSVILEDRRLHPLVEVQDYRNRIRHLGTNGVLEAVSADGKTQHGRTPTLTIMDELHAWPKRDLWEALKTGLLKTPDALNVIITTAGRGTNTLAHEQYDYARKVALGEIDDPGTLPILFEAPKDADWRDEALWHRVNPGLRHGYPNLKALRQLAHEAASRPADRESFRQLNINVWLDGQADPWLELAIYDEGAEPAIDLAEREGEPAWIGVDLGSTSDLTAVVLALRDPDGGFSVVPFVFAPEASLRRRQDRGEAPYVLWAEQGHLVPTPGDVTDFDRVEALIRDLCRRFTVREIALDPWGARPMMNRFLEDGLPAVEHRQGFVSMSGPMKAFERAVLARKLRHGGHPILRWCVENVLVDQDPAGNVKPNKARSREKIDAAVAAIMALGRAEIGQGQAVSMYENPNISVDDLVW